MKYLVNVHTTHGLAPHSCDALTEFYNPHVDTLANVLAEETDEFMQYMEISVGDELDNGELVVLATETFSHDDNKTLLECLDYAANHTDYRYAVATVWQRYVAGDTAPAFVFSFVA